MNIVIIVICGHFVNRFSCIYPKVYEIPDVSFFFANAFYDFPFVLRVKGVLRSFT